MSAHLGLVLHVQAGDGNPYGWFSNPANQASSTWWVAKDGTLVQFVDSDLIAWTQAAGNGTWNGVETEGYPTEPLTTAQVQTLARLYVWGHKVYGWPLVASEDPNTPGFGWHGMGGAAWGGHLSCPGDIRKSQRATVLYLAALVINPSSSPTEAAMFDHTPSGNGYWIAHPDGSVWSFGDAQYLGGCNPGAPGAGGSLAPGETIVSLTAHPTAEGYWLHSSAGHVYAFGASGFHGNA